MSMKKAVKRRSENEGNFRIFPWIFFVCVKLNNGYIRIYFVVFALIGWGVYFFTLGKIIFIIFDFIIKILRSFYYKIKKRITLSTVAILIKTKSQS